MIDTIHPGYCFFVRYFDFLQNLETVIYAIPPLKLPQNSKRSNTRKDNAERNISNALETKRIVSLAHNDGWFNAQILKDCGVIPYLFFKNHHCDVSMVGGRKGEYPNLDYVPGLKMEFLPNGSLGCMEEYLERESKDIDCLLLYGCYPFYHSLADIYKKANPQGKIALALDANSHWMDRIQWNDEDFQRFMNHCNVISAAGRTMQKHLNEKWPWAIEYIPNGFYNFSQKSWEFDINKKENIILTAGGLGTPQKATDVLLEAFARIAGKAPDWELHLAGGIEKNFEEFLKDFRERFPELKERVRFLGKVVKTIWDIFNCPGPFFIQMPLHRPPGGADHIAVAHEPPEPLLIPLYPVHPMRISIQRQGDLPLRVGFFINIRQRLVKRIAAI